MVDPSKNVPDLNCEVQDLLLEVVDLKREAPDLRSGGIRPNLTPGLSSGMGYSMTVLDFENTPRTKISGLGLGLAGVVFDHIPAGYR